MWRKVFVYAAGLALTGCAQTPEAPAPRGPAFVAAPDYPTTVPGVVTVAPLRHVSDVAVIAPDVEHVIWGRSTLDASAVAGKVRPAARQSAPVAPTPCADGDGDGVCDERDRCPDTPRGERVDAAGCTCEMTAVLQFEFDSDELLPEDRLVLDRVATRMKAVELIAGEAIGHTDSIGEPDYNLDLSRRRAQSAVNYLAAQGVTESRITVRGKGESEPVADNATAEGRALNRRVVLAGNGCETNPMTPATRGAAKRRADAQAPSAPWRAVVEDEALKKAEAAEARRQADAKAQAEREAAVRAEREAELQRLLAAEGEAAAFARSGVVDEYRQLLVQTIERNWIRPPSARAGIECTLYVTQEQGGVVSEINVGPCNVDDDVRESIVDAVKKSSPLPTPRDQRAFQRRLEIVFRPKE